MNTSYFEILQQEIEEVYLLINYLILKGSSKTVSQPTDRIRVNDSTATGGWY